MSDVRGALLGRALAGGREVGVGTAGRGGRELWAGGATRGARRGAARPPTDGAEGCTVGAGSGGGALAGASRALGLVAAPTLDFGGGAAGSSSQPASSMSNDRFDDLSGESAPMRPAYDENADLATPRGPSRALSCSVRGSMGACPAQRAGSGDRSGAESEPKRRPRPCCVESCSHRAKISSTRPPRAPLGAPACHNGGESPSPAPENMSLINGLRASASRLLPASDRLSSGRP